MKKTKQTQDVQLNYAAPEVTIIEVDIEKGFAVSGVDTPDWQPGESDFF